VFKGFFERLKNIDVKHAHSSLTFQSSMFDHLQDDEFGRSVA
jgi:U3 small nucleolar RNA-associated protein 20